MTVIKSMRCGCDSDTYVPHVGDDGIYVPYVIGDRVYSQLLISKEMFVEAYNKWIKGEEKNERSNDSK